MDVEHQQSRQHGKWRITDRTGATSRGVAQKEKRARGEWWGAKRKLVTNGANRIAKQGPNDTISERGIKNKAKHNGAMRREKKGRKHKKKKKEKRSSGCSWFIVIIGHLRLSGFG